MDQQPLAWWGGRCAGAAAREPGGRAAAHIHGRDLPHVPRVNVLVELVPARDVPEELAHVRDGADVPRRDGAVRRGCARRVDAPFDQGVLQGLLILLNARRRCWQWRWRWRDLQAHVEAATTPHIAAAVITNLGGVPTDAVAPLGHTVGPANRIAEPRVRTGCEVAWRQRRARRQARGRRWGKGRRRRSRRRVIGVAPLVRPHRRNLGFEGRVDDALVEASHQAS